MSSPIDPVVLLNVLEPILDNRTGGVREIHLANRLVNVMRDARKLVQRCIYLNVIQATRSEETKRQIISQGGWDILYEWLKDAERFRHWAVASDILHLFINLPVSIELIRSNGAPKLIRRLSKRSDIDSAVRHLAIDILSIWKDIVIDDHVSKEKIKTDPDDNLLLESVPSASTGMSSTIDPNIDLEAAEEPSLTAASSSIAPPVDRYGEGKRAENANTHLKVRKAPPALPNHHQQHRLPDEQPLMKLGKSGSLDKTEKLNRKDIEQILNQQHKSNEKEEMSEEKEKNMDKKPNAPGSKKAQADPFSDALAGFDDAAPKRRKTVKTYRTTFRSTGLDQDPEPASTNIKKRKIPVDATNLAKRRESMDAEGHMNGAKHKISQKPYNRPSTPLIKQTSLEKTKSAPSPVATPRLSTDGGQVDQPETLSPTSTAPSAAATKSVKVSSAVAKATQMIESDSFMAALTGSSQPRATAVIRRKKINDGVASKTDGQQIAPPKPQFYKELIRSSDDSSAAPQNIPDPNVGVNQEDNEVGKSSKKRVRWAKESELVHVQYFELEEGERAHKAFGLKNSNLASLDKKMEREAMEAARKGMHKRGDVVGAETETYLNWKLTTFDDVKELASRGSKSEEKKIQQERMKNVLTEIYFTYDMIPDTPKEPDMFVGETQQDTNPVIIPLEDIVTVPSPGLGLQPAALGQPPTMGVAAPTTSLPPELAQLLQNLNKTGILPSAPPPVGGQPPGVAGFGGARMGFVPPPNLQQPPPVGGNAQAGMVQAPIHQHGGFGPGGVVLPNVTGPPISQQMPINQGIPSSVSNAAQQQSIHSNQIPQGPPPFVPHPAAILGSQPGWNSQMRPPNIIPVQGQPGGFRGPAPSAGAGFGSRGRGFAGSQSRGGRFDRECPFFLRGRCTYGDHCRFRHGDGQGRPDGPPPTDSPASPPAGRESRTSDKDRDRSIRSDRNRYRSPPDASRHRHRRSGRSRSPERERDRDYRRKDQSPTYSQLERYRLSPPEQIMDDTTGGQSNDKNGSRLAHLTPLDNAHGVLEENVPVITLADTPASP